MRIGALCGSLRTGSFNQALLEATIELGRGHDLQILQAQIREFPLFNQDLESTPPFAVEEAKRIIQSTDALLLVSPEANYGVPGVLKNAVDWLSRPPRDLTLYQRPMAVIGASTGFAGTLRAQLAWRQMWHFFDAPVFSGAEFMLPLAGDVIDAEGRLCDADTCARLDAYLDKFAVWVMQCRQAD